MLKISTITRNDSSLGSVDGAIAGLYFKDEDINTPVRDRERNFAPEIVKLADELGLLSDSEDSSRLSPIEQFYLDLTPANTDGEESLSSFQNAMGLTEPQTKKLIEYIWAHKPRIGDGAPVREEARNLYRDCQQEICGAVSASPIAAKPQYQQLGIHSVKIGNPNAGAGNNNIILYIDGPGEESAWYKNKAVKANFVLDAAKTGDTVSFGGNTAPFAAKSMNDINNSNVATKWHLRFAQALFAKSGKRFFPGTNADKSLTYESGAELANAILAVLKDWNANGTFATCKQEYLADKTAKQSFA